MRGFDPLESDVPNGILALENNFRRLFPRRNARRAPGGALADPMGAASAFSRSRTIPNAVANFRIN